MARYLLKQPLLVAVLWMICATPSVARDPKSLNVCPAVAMTRKSQDEIRATIERWQTAFNRGEWAKTLDIVAKDQIGWAIGGRDTDYASQARTVGRRVETKRPADGAWNINIDEIVVCGDLAVARTTAKYTPTSPSGGEPSALRTFEIYRRQADRTWKISRFIDQDMPKK